MTAQRGAIVDRNGEPLALSRESAAVYLRPREWSAGPDAVDDGGAPARSAAGRRVLQQASAPAPFVWLQRQVPLDRWSAIEDMKLPGIGSEPARQRLYPQGALAGQVLGFTGVDGHGLEGIERALDAELRGEVEAVVVGHDARGRQFVLGEEWGSLPRAGAQVELTIDAGLQRVAEAELERAVREQGAKAGTLVALDPVTGEVLAMATVPRFDPNQFAGADARPAGATAPSPTATSPARPSRPSSPPPRSSAGVVRPTTGSSARTAARRSAIASFATPTRTAC